MGLELGITYLVIHSGKGSFMLKIKSQNEIWVTGEIVAGKAKAMMSYNEREIGEEITIRKTFCNFTKQNN